MDQKVERLLKGQGENYMLPFFWQHGEDEAVLRDYMRVIQEAGIGAVCVESRPHPDYCGPKWWQDMDVILDEARKRGMKVWILDDSHFPTGFANGALKDAPAELHRQSITFQRKSAEAGTTFTLTPEETAKAAPFQLRGFEAQVAQITGNDPSKGPYWDDERMLGIYAVRTDLGKAAFAEGAAPVDLSSCIQEDGSLVWQVPEGKWKVYMLHLSRNRGPHRDYINMLDERSVKVLVDTVYESHWDHYRDDFGKTIAGFFSDEPEIGNGHLYEKDCQLGCYDEQDYPWSDALEQRLQEVFGAQYPACLALLWDNDGDADAKAYVRYHYMDNVTRLVEKCFSYQLGDWCRAHGVQYIGHLIEDNNQHARTGSSLGHYFRGLAGEDMSGIDDIGGQVIPQAEDAELTQNGIFARDGVFYHYMLGKLGGSAAAIEPGKHGNSMCEIFGNYGWEEGVKLEKYLADHFLVRGINHYVPHAFSPKAFPDPDCPPHFYAHGNNPQYRHFGCLMHYMNRVASLIAGGRHVAPAAVLYHGEGEWMGEAQFSQFAARALTDSQIEFDFVPTDVFGDREHYRTKIEGGKLTVNTQEYACLIIPKTQYITKDLASGIADLQKAGVPLAFVDSLPDGIGDAKDHALPAETAAVPVVSLAEVPAFARKYCEDICIAPAFAKLRFYHYVEETGNQTYLFVNEDSVPFAGAISFAGREVMPAKENAYIYDAWNNTVYAAAFEGNALKAVIEPQRSLILVVEKEPVGELPAAPVTAPEVFACGEACDFSEGWVRSIAKPLDYPSFGEGKNVSLPDALAEEEPDFSGFVRYEKKLEYKPSGKHLVLCVEDASEGVEVFVNGKSLGIEITAPMRYDLTSFLQEGANDLAIEVATTLERQMAKIPSRWGMQKEATCLSGITGKVVLAEV